MGSRVLEKGCRKRNLGETMNEKEVHMYAEVDVEMVYEIPREVAHAARMTPQELWRELAIYLSVPTEQALLR